MDVLRGRKRRLTKQDDEDHIADISKATFAQIRQEALTAAKQVPEDSDALTTLGQTLYYLLGNFVAANSSAYVWILGIITCGMIVFYGALWQLAKGLEGGDAEEAPSFQTAAFVAFTVLSSGEANEDVHDTFQQLVFTLMLLSGLVIFAVLVGFITESVETFIGSLREGRTKVIESGHTVVLGWNETTVRLICQVAFLRQQWRRQNRTCLRRICWWLRTPPSTPIAQGTIVVMNNTRTKQAMDEEIAAALAERGIEPRFNRVGWDIVCRVGDPTNVHDLLRAGVQRAVAVITMMTEHDEEEKELCGENIESGTTMRTLLAIRHVLFTSRGRPNWEQLRIVAQVVKPSRSIDAAVFSAPDGRPLVIRRDLNAYLNSLVFNCTSQPGMSHVLMELLGFQGIAFRCRRASELPCVVGRRVVDCMFLWDDAVLVGVVSSNKIDKEAWDQSPRDMTKQSTSSTVVADGEGLAPRSNRVIVASDMVIFIGRTSMPKLAASRTLLDVWSPKRFYGRIMPTDAEVQIIVTPSPKVATSAPSKPVGLNSPISILVCGWRRDWDRPDQFEASIRDLAGNLPSGSRVWFMCQIKPNHFSELLKEIAGSHNSSNDFKIVGSDWMFRGRVSLAHSEGDAAKYEDLKRVITSETFDEVIVMKTQTATKSHASNHSSDTRLLSILLLLRYIQAELGSGAHPMHIVGENSLDATSRLALMPRTMSGRRHRASSSAAHNEAILPDFVNVQAIYARALAQSLAYPDMQPAIAQLFSSAEGGATIVLQNAREIIADGQVLSFHELKKLVQRDFEDDICLGVLTVDNEMHLAPSLGDACATSNDRIIVLTRRPLVGECTVQNSPRHAVGSRGPSRQVSDDGLAFGRHASLTVNHCGDIGDLDTVPCRSETYSLEALDEALGAKKEGADAAHTRSDIGTPKLAASNEPMADLPLLLE